MTPTIIGLRFYLLNNILGNILTPISVFLNKIIAPYQIPLIFAFQKSIINLKYKIMEKPYVVGIDIGGTILFWR